MSKPYKDIKIENFIIRKFNSNLQETDLKWHRDDNNRKITILAGNNWKFQLDNNIPFKYFELCDFTTLNELYNCLDLYVVSSRYEGGPQAIVECAITKTPIISTDVGLASNILAPESICSFDMLTKAEPNVEHAYNNVLKYKIPQGFEAFVEMFKEL